MGHWCGVTAGFYAVPGIQISFFFPYFLLLATSICVILSIRFHYGLQPIFSLPISPY